jgi:hypothetical protein
MNKYRQVFQLCNVDIFFVLIGREKNQLFNLILGFLKHSITFLYFHLPQDKSTNLNYMFIIYDHTSNKQSTQPIPPKPEPPSCSRHMVLLC